MDQRGSRHYQAIRGDDPWRHHRSQPMTMTADHQGFSFAGGIGGAMDHRHSRSSDWDSRNSRHGSSNYSQKKGSSNGAQTTATGPAVSVHAHEIDLQRNALFSSIGGTTPHLINSSDTAHEDSNRHNNAVIPVRIARAPRHRAKQDLPGPAGAWFRQQKQKTTRQQQNDVTNKKMKMAVGSVPNKLKAVNNDSILAQPQGCTSNSAQNIDNGVGGGRVEQIITQPLRILNSNPLQHQQSHSSPTKSIGVDEIDSTSLSSPNNSGDNIHGKRQQQQLLFHDHSSDLHECNAWNVMCKTLDRIVPPFNHVLLTSSYSCSSSSICREMKYDKGPTHASSLSSSSSSYYSSMATYYKNILRTNIPDNYALIYEIHAGKYDVCHCLGSAASSSSAVDGGSAVLHSDDLRVPLLVGYVASVQCHAHSDWTALLVDEMHSVGTNSKGNGLCRSSSVNASKGILCWIEERLVKQHPNFIRPGAVWMLEGAKLALFASACDEEEEDDDSVDTHYDVFDNGIAAATTGTDTSPSTDNARRRAGAIDRMILAGECSLIYAWTPEEAAPAFTDEEFVALTERRINLVLPHKVDDGLTGLVEEDNCCKAVGSSLGQPGQVVNTAQPAKSADFHSSEANEISDDQPHGGRAALREENRECGGDELLMLMHKSRQDVAQCGDADGTSNDDLGSLKIAQAKETPHSPPSRALATEESILLPRPVIHGRARPVTSESISMTPPEHDDRFKGNSVHEDSKDVRLENSSLEVRCPESRLGKFLDDSKRNNSIDDVQTPATKQGSNTRLGICTGNDSFDDLLDEEFAVTPCGTKRCDESVMEAGAAILDNETASDLPKTREASLLFDLLDGEDLDCLSEEDD